MAIRELSDIDLGDISSWPLWLKLTGTLVVCAAILFAGYWFIVKDQIATLEKAQREEQNLKQVFLDKKALAINLPAYREQMQEIKDRFGVMLRQLPNKTEVPELLIDITQAGLGRGLQFVLFQPQNRRVADFYAELPISIKVNGSYHQLGEFVSDLAALPRIVTIGDIKLEPMKDSELLQMSATTKTYHYLDEEQLAQRRRAQQEAQKKQRRRRGP